MSAAFMEQKRKKRIGGRRQFIKKPWSARPLPVFIQKGYAVCFRPTISRKFLNLPISLWLNEKKDIMELMNSTECLC